jgi:hypothetical protein
MKRLVFMQSVSISKAFLNCCSLIICYFVNVKVNKFNNAVSQKTYMHFAYNSHVSNDGILYFTRIGVECS